MERFDDELVALADLPVQVQIQVFGQSTVGHVVLVEGISLSVGGANHAVALHREFLAAIRHIGIDHAIAVGTACHSHLAVGLHVFTIIDVYHALRAAHSFCHRTIAANLDTVYLASLHIGQE